MFRLKKVSHIGCSVEVRHAGYRKLAQLAKSAQGKNMHFVEILSHIQFLFLEDEARSNGEG